MNQKIIGGHPDVRRRIFMDSLRVGTIQIFCDECGKALVGRIPAVNGRGEAELEKEIFRIRCTTRGRARALCARMRIFFRRVNLFLRR